MQTDVQIGERRWLIADCGAYPAYAFRRSRRGNDSQINNLYYNSPEYRAGPEI